MLVRTRKVFRDAIQDMTAKLDGSNLIQLNDGFWTIHVELRECLSTFQIIDLFNPMKIRANGLYR